MEILSLEVQLWDLNTHTRYGLGLQNFTYVLGKLVLTTIVGVYV